MSLLMIVPSRGRPSAVSSLMQACRATISQPDTGILVCVDKDDPQFTAYLGIDSINLSVGEPSRIGPILNGVSMARAPFYDHIGFMGDDHRPRTPGWDKELCTNGVAYGNDLIHGADLPTSVVMDTRVIRDLGYMIPPGAWHLFFDNAWKDIGEKYGLTYREDVVLEHLHPLVGKAEWDESYLANNSDETWDHDKAIYDAWREEFYRDRRPAV